MDALYRDTMGVARETLRAARQRRREELEALTGLEEVAGARDGRRAAGLVLLTFAAAIALMVVVPAWAAFDVDEPGPSFFFFGLTSSHQTGAASLLLLLSWPVAWAANRLFAARGRASFLRRVKRATADMMDPPLEATATEDAYGVLAQLESGESPAHRIWRSLAAQEGPSLTAWLAGISLLAPLSLHLALVLGPAALACLFVGPGILAAIFPAFDGWMAVSGLVAHALIAPALYAFHFVRRLEDDPDCLPQWQMPLMIATLGTLLFPGLVLGFPASIEGLLPALLVFVTVGTFLPALYERACRSLRGERARLQVCGEAAGVDVRS